MSISMMAAFEFFQHFFQESLSTELFRVVLDFPQCLDKNVDSGSWVICEQNPVLLVFAERCQIISGSTGSCLQGPYMDIIS